MQKLIYTLLGILILTFLVWVAVNHYTKTKFEADKPIIIEIPKINKEEVRKIEITKDNFNIILTKNEKTKDWVIATEDDYPANNSDVSFLLDNFSEVQKGTVCSTNPDNYPIYNVDEKSGIKLSLYDDKKELLSIIVGKSTEDYSNGFVRLVKGKEVLRISKTLRSYVHTDRASWLNKAIFRFDSDKAYAFEIIKREVVEKEAKKEAEKEAKKEGASNEQQKSPIVKEEKVYIEKIKDKWWVILPKKMPLDTSISRDMVSTFSYFDMQDLAPKEERSKLGLDKPTAEITCFYYREKEEPTEGGKEKKKVQVKEKAVLLVGKAVDGSKSSYYAETPDSKRAFVISEAAIKDFLTEPEKLMEKKLIFVFKSDLEEAVFKGFYQTDFILKREEIKETGKDEVKEVKWWIEVEGKKILAESEQISDFVGVINEIKVIDYFQREKINLPVGKTMYQFQIKQKNKEMYSFELYPDKENKKLYVVSSEYPEMVLELVYNNFEQLTNELDYLINKKKKEDSKEKKKK